MYISNLGYALLGVGFMLHFSLLIVIVVKMFIMSFRKKMTQEPSSALFLSGIAFYLLGITIVVVGNLLS